MEGPVPGLTCPNCGAETVHAESRPIGFHDSRPRLECLNVESDCSWEWSPGGDA